MVEVLDREKKSVLTRSHSAENIKEKYDRL